ncbi:hypothetical protein PTSG_02159 [Salpingoeca rosetta]|uniref:Uncharacterized protein n=1 Tax=Salpingoeca rosetta (strain ATCC 50818 / BSB-021) TaxID=946362 RepID=F2U1D6_SALR5|nr:uncharacterized protein PTSG_02159 [Salpingoeca rosetta]EGD81438.1 hypothetical protein PTSG_02159 [Salpingoeca rosetta]|eukprot:XP_004996642.1 hypothetical protein PTSG_02159 [Salpingoeca rosetta]
MDMDYLLPNPARYAPDRLRECLDHFGIKKLVRLYNENIKPMQDDPLMLRDFITSTNEARLRLACNTWREPDDEHSEYMGEGEVPVFIQILSDEALLRCLRKLDHGPPPEITESNRRYCERRYLELLSLGVDPVSSDPDRFDAIPVRDVDEDGVRRRGKRSGGGGAAGVDTAPLLKTQRTRDRSTWTDRLTLKHWVVLLSGFAAVAALVIFLSVTLS